MMEAKKIISLYKIVSRYLPVEGIFSIISSYLEKNLWDYEPHSSFNVDYFREIDRVDGTWDVHLNYVNQIFSSPPCNLFYWEFNNVHCSNNGQLYLWNNSSDRFIIFVGEKDQERIKNYLTSCSNFRPIIDICF